MKDENFDKKIREILDSYEEAPEHDCWEGIENKLDRRKRTGIIRIISYSVAAAAVLIAAFVLALHRPAEDSSSVRLADNSINENITVKENTSSELIAEAENIPVLTVPANEEKIVKAAEEKSEAVKVNAVEEKVVEEKVAEEKVAEEKVAEERVAEERVAEVKEEAAVEETENIYNENLYLEEEKDRKSSRGEFLISASGDFSSSRKSGNVDFSSPHFSNGVNGSASAGDAIKPISVPQHYFPVSAGLELSYFFLNNRLGVGLGVNYTYMESRYDALIHDMTAQVQTEQKLHYIGIPLNLYFNAYTNDYINFYVSFGGMLEKALAADYSFTDLDGNIERVNRKVDGVQMSLSLGLGFEYRFVKFMGIYADPRLTYFFDGGQPYSVRMEQPLQFRLELGFRFHI